MTIKRVLILISSAIYAIIAACVLFVFFAEKYILGTWSELLPDEIIYHLNTSLDGSDPQIYYGYFSTYGIVIVLIVLLLGFIHFILRTDKKTILKLVALCMASLMFFTWTAYNDFFTETGLFDYIATHREYDPDNDFVSQMYVDPGQTTIIFPEKKRNLIYIFLESTEVTFMDKENGGGFDKNCIPELTKIVKEGDTFGYEDGKVNGAYSLPGTNWTIGAMFAQSSGLPLKLTLTGNSMENMDSFFPGIVTLGDILYNEGYNNTILLGSDASFGGRREYYKEHGNYDIHDYYYMLDNGKIPENYKVFWGYEDEKLFEFAKEDLTKISKKDEPFNYNILTVDTHFEDGYVCRLCKDEFGEQYADVFACASRQISDFVEWLKKQDFYENTTVVIAGDHTTMDHDFCENVDKDETYERKALFTILNSAAENISGLSERSYSVLDAFPTTLAAMGCRIMDSMLGLGTNLYSDRPTLVEELGVDLLTEKLTLPSHFFDNYEEAGINEEIIENALNVVSLNPFEENGFICFRAGGINQFFNESELTDGYAKVVFPDGTTKKYDLNVFLQNETELGIYTYDAKTDIKLADFNNDIYEVYLYTSIRDYKDILLCDNLPEDKKE